MQRPTTVTVFGILNIVFGAAAVFCSPLTLITLALPDQRGNPIQHLILTNTAYRAWLIGSIGVGMLAGVVLLAAGIGLLQLKPWARLTSIGYGIFAIVFSVLGSVVNFSFLLQPLREALHQTGPQAVGAIGGLIGGMVGGCFGMIYPILLLFFMTRPNIRAVFQPPPIQQ